MSRFITLTGAEFTDKTLPVVRSYSESILAISGLIGWFNADSASVLVNGSGKVSRLKDKSGNGNDFTQAVEVNKPALAGDLNGFNVLSLTRANSEYMTFGGVYPNGVAAKSTKLILVNVKDDIDSSVANILSHNSPVAGRHALYMNSSGGFAIEGPDSSGVTGKTIGNQSDEWRLIIAEYDSDNGFIKLTSGGESVESIGAFTVTNTGLALGSGSVGSASSTATMDVAEIMLFNDTITDKPETLATIRDYIENKYGISV